MRTTIVTTTIGIPTALANYAANARHYGHKDVSFIVVGDRKTPSETRDFCESLAGYGYPCAYMDIEDQRRHLDRFPELWAYLPFDSIQRRNVGMLKAWEDGADVIVTIDDDNWIMNQDFVCGHGIAGQRAELRCIGSTSGWFNVCSLLEEKNHIPFYHRGYPFDIRWKEEEAFTAVSNESVMVAVNAGFWLDDPDIDALTRMNRRITVKGIQPGARPRIALHSGTWSPFNSQNTALMRDVIPAYLLSPWVGRYDDIWPSYIVNRIAQHLGHVIAFGEPLVRQERNAHDLWRDLDAERNGMMLTPGLCAALRRLPLRGLTYHECYGEIAVNLPAAWKPGERWTESQRAWREKFLEGLRIWHSVFDRMRQTSISALHQQLVSPESAVPVEHR